MNYIVEDEGPQRNIHVERVQYGIWDHQDQRLINRYVRPIDAEYKRVETKFPRIFNQLNHATTALNQILTIEPGAYARYEVVTINVSYEMQVGKPAAARNENLVRKRALSKLSTEEKQALGIAA